MHWCARKYRLAHVGVHINELVASNNLKKSQTYESLGIIILNIVENQQHHPLIKHGDGQSYTNESVYRKQICKHIKQKYWLYYVWVPESIWNRQPVLLLLQVALPLLPSVHAKTHLARLVGPKCRAAGNGSRFGARKLLCTTLIKLGWLDKLWSISALYSSCIQFEASGMIQEAEPSLPSEPFWNISRPPR